MLNTKCAPASKCEDFNRRWSGFDGGEMGALLSSAPPAAYLEFGFSHWQIVDESKNNNNTFLDLRDDADETHITETKGDMGLRASLGYLRSIQESGIKCCKAMRKLQVCQGETKTRELTLQDYTELPGTLRAADHE